MNKETQQLYNTIYSLTEYVDGCAAIANQPFRDAFENINGVLYECLSLIHPEYKGLMELKLNVEK